MVSDLLDMVFRAIAEATVLSAIAIYALQRFIYSDVSRRAFGAVALGCGRVGAFALGLTAFSVLTSNPVLATTSASTQWAFGAVALCVSLVAWWRVSDLFNAAASKYSERLDLFGRAAAPRSLDHGS